MQDFDHRRELRHQRREQAEEAGRRVPGRDVDAGDGQDVDRDRLSADRHQGGREELHRAARRVFHRADGAPEGREIFHRPASRHGHGRMQRRLRPGAELRLSGRPAFGRPNRAGDEQGLLQGVAGRGLKPMAPPEIDARRAGVGILVVFLAPALLVYAGFTIYPVLRTFYNAFHSIKPQGMVEFVGLSNFTALLFTDSIFWKAVANTSVFTIVATLVDVIGGLLLALCLFARAPLAPLLRVVWFTPVLMSYVVVGIIWVWIYDYDWGLANAVLRWIGLGAFEQSWLGHPSTALWSVLARSEE